MIALGNSYEKLVKQDWDSLNNDFHQSQGELQARRALQNCSGRQWGWPCVLHGQATRCGLPAGLGWSLRQGGFLQLSVVSRERLSCELSGTLIPGNWGSWPCRGMGWYTQHPRHQPPTEAAEAHKAHLRPKDKKAEDEGLFS